MEFVVNSTVYEKQTKARIKSELEPYFNEWEEIKKLKNDPNLTKEFLLDWIENFVSSAKLSTK